MGMRGAPTPSQSKGTWWGWVGGGGACVFRSRVIEGFWTPDPGHFAGRRSAALRSLGFASDAQIDALPPCRRVEKEKGRGVSLLSLVAAPVRGAGRGARLVLRRQGHGGGHEHPRGAVRRREGEVVAAHHGLRRQGREDVSRHAGVRPTKECACHHKLAQRDHLCPTPYTVSK